MSPLSWVLVCLMAVPEGPPVPRHVSSPAVQAPQTTNPVPSSGRDGSNAPIASSETNDGGEVKAIESLLKQYRDAFAALDVSRVLPLWPTVDERALIKAFARLEQQYLAFKECKIAMTGMRAEVLCTGNVRIVSRIGNGIPVFRDGRWKFSLRRSPAGWLIQSVEAR